MSGNALASIQSRATSQNKVCDSPKVDPSDWAQRLGYVRVFARHWHATDPRTEIPANGLLPFRPQRARPYLYSEQEIQKLLAAALKLSPDQEGLRPRTYH